MVAALEDVDVQIQSSFHSSVKKIIYWASTKCRCWVQDWGYNGKLYRYASCSEIAYSPVEDRGQWTGNYKIELKVPWEGGDKVLQACHLDWGFRGRVTA